MNKHDLVAYYVGDGKWEIRVVHEVLGDGNVILMDDGERHNRVDADRLVVLANRHEVRTG